MSQFYYVEWIQVTLSKVLLDIKINQIQIPTLVPLAIIAEMVALEVNLITLMVPAIIILIILLATSIVLCIPCSNPIMWHRGKLKLIIIFWLTILIVRLLGPLMHYVDYFCLWVWGHPTFQPFQAHVSSPDAQSYCITPFSVCVRL